MTPISKIRNPLALVGKTLKSGQYTDFRKQKQTLAESEEITKVKYGCNIFNELCLCLTLISKQEFYIKTTETLSVW